MKVCFAGIGSIARRHIRNLRNVCADRGTELKIDALRRTYEPIDSVDEIYTDFDELPGDYDVIFITNPTECHLETLKRVHNRGRHFFIEKPVVSTHQIDEARLFTLKPEAVYYIACPLRYNAVIQWVKENIDPNNVISVRSISSSYLPDWRPGQDYRKIYSAHKDMGGGVSIDLIHEWDYLTYLFGRPSKVQSFIGKKSALEIDSDDYAIYMAEYEDKIVELHLDYFGRKTIRKIQLFMKDDTIIGDITNNQIHFLCSDKTLNFHEERDDFQKRELCHFLDMIQQLPPLQEFTRAIEVLALTKGEIKHGNSLCCSLC